MSTNYLDEGLSKNMILVPDTSNPKIVKDALSGHYDMVYVTVNAALPLMKKDWVPIVQRTARIQPVILVLKDSNIKNEQDLKNKKIVASKGVPITEYTKYHLYKDHIITSNKNFIEKPLNQQELLAYLTTKQADAIVVLKKIALNFMKNNNNLQIIYNTPSAPGQIVLINPSKINPEEQKIIENELLAMAPNMPGAKATLTAINGYDFKENPFSQVNPDDIQEAVKMVQYLKNVK
jgi:ABC-type phosphate/phosphonate transport system substrate-binding protein